MTINTDGLEKLKKALENQCTIKIGILSGKNSRSDGKSNATIGAVHEYGTREIPQRSFLRMHLNEKLNTELTKAKLTTKETLKEVIKSGSMLEWSKLVGVAAYKVIMEAFATEGFGKWPKWKNPDYSNNANMILVDTQQLRDSITFEVKEEKK